MGTSINKTSETETSSLFMWAPGTVYSPLQKVADQYLEEIRVESLKAGVGRLGMCQGQARTLAEKELRGMAGEGDMWARKVVYHHCSLSGVGVSGKYKSNAN